MPTSRTYNLIQMDMVLWKGWNSSINISQPRATIFRGFVDQVKRWASFMDFLFNWVLSKNHLVAFFMFKCVLFFNSYTLLHNNSINQIYEEKALLDWVERHKDDHRDHSPEQVCFCGRYWVGQADSFKLETGHEDSLWGPPDRHNPEGWRQYWLNLRKLSSGSQ